MGGFCPGGGGGLSGGFVQRGIVGGGGGVLSGGFCPRIL